MGSFSTEDFVGNGSLKAITEKLLQDGWDDVPTLKLMTTEDMNALNMTQEQKDAMEIRSYLHDRALMQYADQIEASRKCLPELLNLSMGDLSAQFGMKRGHIARFMDRTYACAIDPLSASIDPLSASTSLTPRRRISGPSRNNSIYKTQPSHMNSRRIPSMTRMAGKTSVAYDISIEQSMADLKIKDGHVFKGIVASMPAEPRACGCVQPPPVVENVAPLSTIESVSVQKLTPEYKVGMERLVKTKTPPMKASELWRDKTALLLCLRRPGSQLLCQFIERNFGDWAPLPEVLEICSRLQNQQSQSESIKYSREG